MANFYSQTVTFFAANSLSTGAVYRGLEWGLCALLTPSIWTTASITFRASFDGGTSFRNMYNAAGTELALDSSIILSNRYIALDPKDFIGVSGLKLRSGTSAVPVTQPVKTTVTLVFRRFA